MIDQLIFVSPVNTQLGYFTQFLPKSVPYGAGLMASRMRALGEQVHLWDMEVDTFSDDQILELACNDGANLLFGISCMTPNAAQGYAFSRRVRQLLPQAKIVFGGIHPTALPEEPILKRLC